MKKWTVAFALPTIALALGSCPPAPERQPPAPDPTVADFRVLSVAAEWAPEEIRTDQTRTRSFGYDCPMISLSAKVTCARAFPGWEVGIIQAIAANENIVRYAGGYASWELPFLPISDSNGADSPFYGPLAHYAAAGEVGLSYVDRPMSYAEWAMPLPPDGRKRAAADSLRAIERNQTFCVWIAVVNRDERKALYLKEVVWRLDVRIELDCARKRGERVRSATCAKGPPEIRDPTRAPAGYPAWLDGPAANDSQRYELYLDDGRGGVEAYAF